MTPPKTGYNPYYEDGTLTLDQLKTLESDVLLEFGTPWCGYCQSAQSAIQEALSGNGQILHLKYYDGKGKPLGRTFQVKLWPTLILLRGGAELARLVRPVHADEVRKLVQTPV
jgi:thioredoxin